NDQARTLQLSHPTLSQSIWRSGENPGKVPLKPNIGLSNDRFGLKAAPSRALKLMSALWRPVILQTRQNLSDGEKFLGAE
ncbi:MAG TPA: hypothetical protein VI075_05235, partial [Methyloceanibacter sp.]